MYQGLLFAMGPEPSTIARYIALLGRKSNQPVIQKMKTNFLILGIAKSAIIPVAWQPPPPLKKETGIFSFCAKKTFAFVSITN